MPKYKITASKSQKKYIFVINEKNDKLAKKRIHDEGYSILSFELFDESVLEKNAFIFEAEKDFEIKKGKVVGNDIFKIYLKLRDGMGYKVTNLYPANDTEKTKDQKNSIIKDLEEQYNYLKSINKEAKKEEKKESNPKDKINIDNFYLKKELEETYKLIDFVLNKLNNLLVNNKYILSDTRKEKLKNLYNSLVKIKSSTNISKLREVGEAVLLKIGEIELEYLEKSKDDSGKKFLSETNRLLKQIGSEKKFTPENQDIKKQLSKFFILLSNLFKKSKKTKKTSNHDKTSHEYLRTIIFLNKYKQKLNQNNKYILKNIFIFFIPLKKNRTKKQDILVRRRVIKQNIFLFKAKLQGKVFSYTKAIKGFDYFLENIFRFFNYIKDYLFFVIIFYTIIFLLFLNLNYYGFNYILIYTINYNGIFYFIMFLCVYFCIYFSRGIYTLIINFSFLFFIIILSLINF